MRQLIVILGAGASHDCATQNHVRDSERRPPLTKDLFNTRNRRGILNVLSNYPLAQAVASDLQPLLARVTDALPLEAFLRDTLMRSDHEHRRAQYWSVPLYLQDLLHGVSLEFTEHPDNYDRLLTALLDLESVIFVTLNYDTIFDRRLVRYRPLKSTEDYIAGTSGGLIKLHGSTNWGRLLQPKGADVVPMSPIQDGYSALCLALARDDFTLSKTVDRVFPPEPPRGISQLRVASDGSFLYPALAAPLGSDDELVCPPKHIDYLKSRLDQKVVGYGLNLLIIGYSCLDKRVLELIKKSGNRIQSLEIVNGDEPSGTRAYRKLLKVLKDACARPEDVKDDYVYVHPGNFSDYTQSDRLAKLVERVS